MKRPALGVQRDAAQAAGADSPRDGRVYVSVHQLMGLHAHATSLSFLPKQPVHSLLAGRHASRIRGRGLNFEELRAYQPGDDVRMIDWKVTARTRSAHTRVFTEERDRSAMLIVDQRIGMFYGTQLNMKSVTAAHTAGIAAWRVLGSGDRVGAILFNDQSLEELRPQRSRNHVARILSRLADYNNQLRADSTASPAPEALNKALDAASQQCKHDCLVVVISDMFGFNDQSRRHLLKLAQHNDVVIGLIHDPSASGLASSSNFFVTDGSLHVELPLKSGRERKRIEDASKGRMNEVIRLARTLPIVVLPLSAGEPVEGQLMRLLGGRKR